MPPDSGPAHDWRDANRKTFPMNFADLGVPASLIKILEKQGITTPTPIQAATLPDSLAGRDVLGRGRTGSGKTYAFVLPLIARLDASKMPAMPRKPRALILAPTRELVGQIHAALKPMADAAGLSTVVIYGGVGQGPQTTALKKGVDIVIACPGRLEDLMGQGLRRPVRDRDHHPRRGRPHGRPRLPARRAPDHGQDAAHRTAPAVLRDARQGDRRAGQALPDQPGHPRGRLGPVAGLDDVAPRAARLPRPARAGARRPDQRPRPHGRLHPHQARRQGAGPPAQQVGHPVGRPARQPQPERAHAQHGDVPLAARPRPWSRPTSPRAASTSTTWRS